MPLAHTEARPQVVLLKLWLKLLCHLQPHWAGVWHSPSTCTDPSFCTEICCTLAIVQDEHHIKYTYSSGCLCRHRESHLAFIAFVPVLLQLPASRHSKPSQQCITAAKFNISHLGSSLQFTTFGQLLALCLSINRSPRCLLTFQRDTSSWILTMDYTNPFSLLLQTVLAPKESTVWGIYVKCNINNFKSLQEQNCHKLFEHGNCKKSFMHPLSLQHHTIE